MPEELCQVSPISHCGVLAQHSDPSPYDQSLGQWDSCDVKCEEAQWELLDREEEYTTGFSMKPNTTRFHIKAPFCHTITASQCFDDDDFEDEEGK